MHVESQLDRFTFGEWGLSKATEGRAEDGPFEFKARVVANVEEWVHFQEKYVENLVAVVLVLVTTPVD